MVTDSQTWAADTFQACKLGDLRRTQRLVETATYLAENPGASLYKACKDSPAAAEGGYRFVRNDSIEPNAILEGGFFSAREKLERLQSDILAIEDTTGMTFNHSVAGFLEGINTDADLTRGWLIHSVVAADAATGDPLALLHQKWWLRDPGRLGTKHRHKQAYEQKESYKWEEATEAVLKECSPDLRKRLVWVCDREADITRYLQFLTSESLRYVIRASWNRRTSEGHLWEQMASMPAKFERTIQIEQRGMRPARQVTLEVRYGYVEMQPKGKSAMTVGAIWAIEKQDPKTPSDGRLEWMVLTSEPLLSNADAEKVLGWYERRWLIEEFHRAWKSGCKAQARRMGTPDNLQRLVAILAFLGVRLLQLQHAHLSTPQAPCTTLLSEKEWRLLWLFSNKKKPQKPPTEPPTIEWAVLALARAGGWGNTKRTGRPGSEAIADGLSRLRDFVEGYDLARAEM